MEQAEEESHLTCRRWGCRGKMALELIKTSTSQVEKQAAERLLRIRAWWG